LELYIGTFNKEAKRLRRVKFFRYNKDTKKYDIEVLGLFHGWGLEIDEGDSEGRFNNYTVAIVELDDGSIDTPLSQCIQFIKES